MKLFLLCGTKVIHRDCLKVPVLCRLMILAINYVPLHVNPLVTYSRNIQIGKALVEMVAFEEGLHGIVDSFTRTAFLFWSKKRNYFAT